MLELRSGNIKAGIPAKTVPFDRPVPWAGTVDPTTLNMIFPAAASHRNVLPFPIRPTMSCQETRDKNNRDTFRPSHKSHLLLSHMLLPKQ